MTIKTLELKQKQFLLEYLLGAKRSSKHRTREALNPKTSSPSQGWHCWIKIGCRRVPRTNSSRTYPHQTPALDCANSIKLRLNMSGWILASHKVKFWKNYVGCHAAARNPPSCLKSLRPWTWRFSLQWLFTRRVAHKQNLLHKTVRSCSIARVLGLNMDIRWKHLNFKTDTRTHASHANTNICKSIMYTHTRTCMQSNIPACACFGYRTAGRNMRRMISTVQYTRSAGPIFAHSVETCLCHQWFS